MGTGRWSLAGLRGRSDEVDLDDVERRLVWMLCTTRSGSTWLAGLLTAAGRVLKVDEPQIAAHLGIWTKDAVHAPVTGYDADVHMLHRVQRDRADYFFSDSYRDAWGPALRAMMLQRFQAQAAAAGHPEARICVKEPNGAEGAGLVLGVLPGVHLLHLVRDPRDTVSSQLDAFRPGTWFEDTLSIADLEKADRESLVREFALMWRVRAQVAVEAFERHDPALRHRVSYEDLRADTPTHLSAILRWLGIDDGEAEVAARRLSFEAVPVEQRGAGKFVRKAQPGGWRDDLAPGEQSIVTEICGEYLQQLGYAPA